MAGEMPILYDWDDLRDRINSQLATLVGQGSGGQMLVRQALAQSVTGPGKRVRAMLVTLAALDFGIDSAAAVDAGCAIELVHTASLLLDDLPCMDDAQTRRGQPTVHIAFGEDVAILTSIALLGEAFGLVARLDGTSGEQRAAMSAALAEAIGVSGLVGGQYADLRHSASYLDGAMVAVNDRKTGALFVAALAMAGQLAGLSTSQHQQMRRAGLELGRAFQLYDDLLDVLGDARRMGKDVGKDKGKNLLTRFTRSGDLLEQVESHIEAARTIFAALPSGGLRLRAFLDYVFGARPVLQGGPRHAGLMPDLLS